MIMTITTVGICTALMTICSWISTPAIGPMVQFTLQTFAVFFIAGMFPLKISLLTLTVYIALGIAGIPVFSNFKSGIAVIEGPTGGYIVGFFFLALIIGLFSKIKEGSTALLVIGMIIGLAVCYAFGTAWFYFVFLNTENRKGILEILSICVFPFLIPDALKMGLAVFMIKKLYLNDNSLCSVKNCGRE